MSITLPLIREVMLLFELIIIIDNFFIFGKKSIHFSINTTIFLDIDAGDGGL